MASQIRSKRLVGIEQNRDRAVVCKLNGHMRLEYSGFNADIQRLKRAHKFFVTRFALFRRCRLEKTWTPLAAGVAVECELRYGQNCATGIQERTVHLSLIVIKDSQVQDFFSHRCCDVGRIFAAYGNQHDQASVDFTCHAAFDYHARMAHSLNDRSHRLDSTHGGIALRGNSCPYALQRKLQRRTAFFIHADGRVGIEIVDPYRAAAAIGRDVDNAVFHARKAHGLELDAALQYERELADVGQ
jgi:hypothetical protein